MRIFVVLVEILQSLVLHSLVLVHRIPVHLEVRITQFRILTHGEMLPYHVVVLDLLTWLWFDIVICRFDIDEFTIDFVTFSWTSEIDTEQFVFVLLSEFFVFESHFYKAKASASGGLPVPHDDGIDHCSKLLEVVDQVAFLSLVSKPTNK